MIAKQYKIIASFLSNKFFFTPFLFINVLIFMFLRSVIVFMTTTVFDYFFLVC